MANKVDSNVTGGAFAEEESLKVLPVSPVWYDIEPNSWSDFGGEIAKIARSPINPSRQNQRDTTVDLDAAGGFNQDFTQNNMTRLLQGYFFADARQFPSTVPLMGSSVTITDVDAGDKTYSAASGLGAFSAKQLVFASGFSNSVNNGLKTVTASTATAVTVFQTIADETPPATARLDVVGYAFDSGDVNLTVTSGIPALTSGAVDFTDLDGLYAGLWVFVGGDSTNTRFANNVGYARIASVATGSITFDETSWTPVTEAGTGKGIRLFFPTSNKNEKDPTLIKRRSYNIERTLGFGENGIQAEYIEGAVANEMTLNLQQADKMNVDLTFVACDHTHRSGDSGDERKAGTHVTGLGESAFNTTSNIYRIKLSLLDPTTSAPAPLFGYLTEATLNVNNGVTPNKALGVMGAFDTSAANFVVSGSLTAYFSTTEAVRAVRNNVDVGFNIICASRNAGFIFDIPMLGLGGGRINVEQDKTITVPLDKQAAECKNGYTLMYCNFLYLPTIAMP